MQETTIHALEGVAEVAFSVLSSPLVQYFHCLFELHLRLETLRLLELIQVVLN